MRITRHLPISQLVIDRYPLGRRTASLMDHLEAGGTVPPIHVQVLPCGQYKVLDGRHRTLAHRMLERETILARYGVSA